MIPHIDLVLYIVAVFLLLNAAVGVARIIAGPSARDRLAAFLLVGTSGIALLAVVAGAEQSPALRDAALTVALLASVVVLVHARGRSEAR